MSGLPEPHVCVSAFLSPCRCQVSSFLCIRRQVCQHDFPWFLTGYRQAINVAIQAVILKQLKSPFPVRAAIFNGFHGELPSKLHDVYRTVYRHSWLRKHSGHHRKWGLRRDPCFGGAARGSIFDILYEGYFLSMWAVTGDSLSRRKGKLGTLPRPVTEL